MGGQQAGVSPAQGPGRTNLALIYQEILTAITRFRSNRQAVADAGSFRNQIKSAIGAAEAEATKSGYAADDVRLATFAVVALLDESILNSNNPIFSDWPRMPLQEELFGVHTAGEMFFQCVDRLMGKSDSPQTADVLEIYALCLLLGYRGRYSISGQESTRVVASTVAEKLQHLRGGPHPLASSWAPPRDAVQQKASDPWVRALLFGTLGALFFAILFFVGFKFALISGASGLHSITALPPH
ncbi:MAG TPA: DotU family type IV/VI secretion system protein [Terriglobia bacterium]|nr:DotU family type IV/VI secretion system protein [Terriglobia bacterium]